MQIELAQIAPEEANAVKQADAQFSDIYDSEESLEWIHRERIITRMDLHTALLVRLLLCFVEDQTSDGQDGQDDTR